MFVANWDSDNVVAFRIDQQTGMPLLLGGDHPSRQPYTHHRRTNGPGMTNSKRARKKLQY
jgi:hypothetical protein